MASIIGVTRILSSSRLLQSRYLLRTPAVVSPAATNFNYLINAVYRFSSNKKVVGPPDVINLKQQGGEEEEEERTVTLSSEYAEEDTEDVVPPQKDFSSVDKTKFTEKIEIKVPDLGEEKAQVEKWYKKEGDFIQTNDILCDISTELFTFGMSVDDECDGIMGEIIAPVQSEPLTPGQLLCYILHEPENQQEHDTSNKEQDCT
uniref:Lipoyl-binding domain-containing protein n=1 Tax=Eucampia antarctica TaxID=49252 RepID=A0A7S2VXX3_9STRA|mmetsp:Transcript_10969/g.10484  ORF Transcript_10969/g.10484 Transcript_10969/m.10484 type:complete len:203 (+) Transcript_10969:44-652(+)